MNTKQNIFTLCVLFFLSNMDYRLGIGTGRGLDAGTDKEIAESNYLAGKIITIRIPCFTTE